jgi:hypothetical protein
VPISECSRTVSQLPAYPHSAARTNGREHHARSFEMRPHAGHVRDHVDVRAGEVQHLARRADSDDAQARGVMAGFHGNRDRQAPRPTVPKTFSPSLPCLVAADANGRAEADASVAKALRSETRASLSRRGW